MKIMNNQVLKISKIALAIFFMCAITVNTNAQMKKQEKEK